MNWLVRELQLLPSLAESSERIESLINSIRKLSMLTSARSLQMYRKLTMLSEIAARIFNALNTRIV